MPSLILFFTTAAFEFAIEALLVGAALAIWTSRRPEAMNGRKLLLALVLVFALLDLYSLPAIIVADATITIRNEALIRLFGQSTVDATELLLPGVADLGIWALQGLLAVWFAARLATRHPFVANA